MIKKLKKLLFSWKTLSSIIIVVIIFYILFNQIDLDIIKNVILNIKIRYVLLAILTYYIIFALKAGKFLLMLKNTKMRVGFKDISEIYYISQFINCIIPFRAGDFYNVYLLKKNYKTPMSKIFGIKFIERALDFTILTLSAAVFAVIFFKNTLPNIIINTVLIGIIIVIGILAVYAILMKGKIMRKIIPKKLRALFDNFITGLKESLKVKNIHIIIFLSILMWVLVGLKLLFVIKAFSLEVPFALIVLTAFIAEIVSTIPLTTGGLGIAELSISGILIFSGINKNFAVPISIISRMTDYWNHIVTGFFLFLFSKKN